jgi:hypothetical protein
LSPIFTDKAIYFKDNDAQKLISVIRHTGLCLDVFNDMSIWAISAKTPFIRCIERIRYFDNYYEIDDLFFDQHWSKNIFSLAGFAEKEDEKLWEYVFFDLVLKNVLDMLEKIEKSGYHILEAPKAFNWKQVRENKVKKMGIQLFKVKRKNQ